MVRISDLEPDRRTEHYIAFSVSVWEAEMQEYRAYFVGPDGHVQNRVDLRCADDAEASRLAKQLFDGRDVELWQLDRKIGTFRDTTSSNASKSVTLVYAR